MVLNWQTISLKNKKTKKIIALFMAAALFLTGVAPSFADDSKGQQMSPSVRISSKDAPSVEGTSAILMDAGSGEILYEKMQEKSAILQASQRL